MIKMTVGKNYKMQQVWPFESWVENRYESYGNQDLDYLYWTSNSFWIILKEKEVHKFESISFFNRTHEYECNIFLLENKKKTAVKTHIFLILFFSKKFIFILKDFLYFSYLFLMVTLINVISHSSMLNHYKAHNDKIIIIK